MPATLTTRYIDATVRSLPTEVQEDVREELSASIADAVEARLAQGEDPRAAERAVLTELGDPAVLAAGYADRPLQLIGPRYFLTWLRLLRLVLMIVVPVVAVIVGLVEGLSGGSVGDVIGEVISVGLSVAVHIAFWVTVAFAVLERSGAETGLTWTVDQLPEQRSTGTGRADLIASLSFLALALGALAWDRLRGLATVDGETLQALHPGLWSAGILVLVALVLLEAALAVVIYRRGRWSIGTAVANSALAVGFMSWSLTLLGREQLLNPELLAAARSHGVDAESMRILGIALVLLIVGIALWDIVDGWVKTARDRRR
ncbi:hypothetical protein CFK38_00560 [Brachybacterium vulturis]|uniref:Uncharacterized protein n=1 Tax=Brachybacterium vulturis TaxID=2017484 RepID=A0A291GJ13_9MICO|nr:permease prefix domain 1-containing protein [Brachybacterium vulturis]ATG50177.1 hypothetical protein CFK38_00560 [Brachybacterium vulturis]